MSAIENIYQPVTDFTDKVMGTGPAQSGEEPLSGIQGEGTADDPYDQGNVEQPAESGEEPPSGIQGKGTATDPYDGGNAPENPSKSDSPTLVAPAQATNDSAKSTVASGNSTASKPVTVDGEDTRGRDPLKAPPRRRQEEGDVSPGTLADGSHVPTSGDRGENYEPGKLSKLKGKLSFGRH
ncbi:hypothetical protein A1O3_05125 [Capronia epimyces CBS 606.96]|uniref:Uncharacterized protein n=1 Tax=Capronia epimyces CBS 606.96 TaxID=1182542 RepID=W9XV80_9EURO|nr:uncharacterized protein A1O3_05125 [Capronia epimyces CBS 606.96]EXJ84457.1 hypothetical protein A1O3_05125 [Capronia epimyces CBS 606.96]